ncbi:polymorphic toxin-type HINT domain-containing protein [Xanthomonas maliensis]|uniref:polymorphic toxin-type HINT domain-containing protein n=1 Tax=Xanthomonas maliensis TaxID=1321368 RepID=UPI0003B79B5F|nr:polymorphic toxin-type HINT domain-containing protein [Xanthomonas maliensis]
MTSFAIGASVNKVWAGVAGGAVAGATFDTILQLGLQQIYDMTNGRSGQHFSITEVLMSTVFGGTLGGLPAKIFQGIGKLVGIGSDPVQGKIGQADPRAPVDETVDLTHPLPGGSKVTVVDAGIPVAEDGAVVTLGGKVVFTAPLRNSMTIAEASSWYLGKVQILDQTQPLSVQVTQAWQLRQALRNAAASAMHDQNLAAEFLETYKMPSLQQIRAKYAGDFSGDPLQQKMLSDVITPDDYRYPSQAGGCFIAGTLVWTDRGLVPIEQLKIGDSVLSQPEETGEQAYRKVVRTFSYEDKEILCVRYGIVGDETSYAYYNHYATDNHPFWVKGVGWTRADLLEPGHELELQDGRQAFVLGVVPVYKTDRPNAGWEPEYSHSVDGFEADYSQGWEWIADGVGEPAARRSDDAFLSVKVYNIEVEGFHTYYVGKAGVWVHNADCANRVHPCFHGHLQGRSRP